MINMCYDYVELGKEVLSKIKIREFILFPFLPSFKGYYCESADDLKLVLTFVELGYGTQSDPKKFVGSYDRTFKGSDWYFMFPYFNEPNYYNIFYVETLSELQTDFDLFLSRYAAK